MSRYLILDIARGVALIAMTVFHFNFDLELLGFKPAGYINQSHWVIFARGIAASFLILVGIGLVLAHQRGVVWRKFGIRFAKIAGAACIITVATWFATPDVFIFFGILHAIAAYSLIGLLFLRVNWAICFALAAVWIPARPHLQTPLLDDPIWWWSGLSQIVPNSSDYVPFFPWFGPILIGIGLGKLAAQNDWFDQVAISRVGPLSGSLAFLGRHSLIYYLLHQPVMIGALSGYLWLTGH